MSKLRAVTILQKKFATAHADKGFACELPLLRPADSEQNPTDYDPLRFLATGISVGYNLLLANCHTDDKGVVHYEVSAVPIERGTTGFYAFCTDDSGSPWYDAKGSATNCLASRRVLE